MILNIAYMYICICELMCEWSRARECYCIHHIIRIRANTHTKKTMSIFGTQRRRRRDRANRNSSVCSYAATRFIFIFYSISMNLSESHSRRYKKKKKKRRAMKWCTAAKQQWLGGWNRRKIASGNKCLAFVNIYVALAMMLTVISNNLFSRCLSFFFFFPLFSFFFALLCSLWLCGQAVAVYIVYLECGYICIHHRSTKPGNKIRSFA